jgi:CRP-like cAMP-binding protein
VRGSTAAKIYCGGQAARTLAVGFAAPGSRRSLRPAGEQSDSALLIKKGHVKAMRGRPPRIIDVRCRGEIVGEMGVIRWKPRMASIIAFDDVEALHLPGSRWLQFL